LEGRWARGRGRNPTKKLAGGGVKRRGARYLERAEKSEVQSKGGKSEERKGARGGEYGQAERGTGNAFAGKAVRFFVRALAALQFLPSDGYAMGKG